MLITLIAQELRKRFADEFNCPINQVSKSFKKKCSFSNPSDINIESNLSECRMNYQNFMLYKAACVLRVGGLEEWIDLDFMQGQLTKGIYS